MYKSVLIKLFAELWLDYQDYVGESCGYPLPQDRLTFNAFMEWLTEKAREDWQ